MFIFQLPGDNQNFMNFKLSVCFSTALLKSCPKHKIIKFYNPSDQFKDLKLTMVEIFSRITNSVWTFFWENFINDDQNASVKIWLKFAQCHICCKTIMLLWSSWLVTCFLYLGPMSELQQGYWWRFDIQFSIFWKFSAHLTYANQTSISAEFFTGTILPGFSNTCKVRYITMHSQKGQFHLKWSVTWTKKV